MKIDQKGFGLIGIISMVAVLVLVVLAGWKVYDSNQTSANKDSNNVSTKMDNQPEKVKLNDKVTSENDYDPAVVSTIKNFNTAASSLKKAMVIDYYPQAKKDCDIENASVSPDARLDWVITVQKMVRDEFAGVQFCGSGGTSILAKVNGSWNKIGSLAMAPSCKLVDQYKISKEITSTCYEDDGTSRVVEYL